MPSPEGAGDPPRRAQDVGNPSKTRGALAALQHREFRYYAAGRFLATVALQMQGLAVGFQVYAVTGRKIDLALIGLAQFLPIVTLSIGAGQLADRLDRRLILIACDV